MQKLNHEPLNEHRHDHARLRARGALALLIYCGLCAKVSNAQEDQILPPGLYRLEMIMASTTRVPFFGKSKSASKSISLVEIKRDGAEVIQSHKACDFRVLDDSKFIKMIFPEKFIAALAKHTYPVQFDKDAQGWRYRADLGVERIGVVKAVYPVVWGLLQVVTGPLSDRVGRKGLIAWGMVVQAGGIWLTVLLPAYPAWLLGAGLQGVGTAMVYPTLLAAITDHAHPTWRASSLGVYRFWRDLGYAVGALLSGAVADLVGLGAAIHVVAALTLLSGIVVARLMEQPQMTRAVAAS